MFKSRLPALLLMIAMIVQMGCGATSATENLYTPEASPMPPTFDQQEADLPSSVAGLTAERKLEDLNFLCDTLEKGHKNLYAKVSKEQFAEKRDAIADKLSAISDSEFYMELCALVASVGDSHTTIALRDKKNRMLCGLPFAVSKIDGEWRLVMAEKKNSGYFGQIVTAINDTPMEEVYSRAETVVSHDSAAWMDKQFSNAISFAVTLEYLGVIPDTSEATLHLKDPKTSLETALVVPSMSETEILSAEIVSMLGKNSTINNPNKFFSSADLGADTFFIQYNRWVDSPAIPMETFVANTEATLASGNFTKVIVDLRYNSSDNSSLFEPMIDSLGALQKKKGFKIYTLIGASTFSSAVINVVQLQERTQTTLVGEPTGGSVNHYGEAKRFDLRNLPVTISYSTNYFEMIKGYAKDSLYPDITVTPSLEDVLAGTDCEVREILAL